MMLIHTVIFWLKEGLNDEDRAKFFNGVRSLGTFNRLNTPLLAHQRIRPKGQWLMIPMTVHSQSY